MPDTHAKFGRYLPSSRYMILVVHLHQGHRLTGVAIASILAAVGVTVVDR